MSLHILNHDMVQPIFNLTNTLGASHNNSFNHENSQSQIKAVPLKIQSNTTSNFSSEYHEDKESSSS